MSLRLWFFIISVFTSYQLHATPEVKVAEPQKHQGFVDLKSLAKRAEQKKLVMPKPMKDGRIQTKNRKGGAIPSSNSLIKEFVEYCKTGHKKILHIDATYGHHTLRALTSNLKEYVATDDNLDHLSLLAIRARNLLDPNTLEPLKLFHGKFPADYSHFPDDHFDAILLNRVIHFYSPDQIKRTMKEVHRILKPGGEVYVVAITPYVKRYESFIPLYKQRKLLRHAYPGHLRNLRMFANPEVTPQQQMDLIHNGEFMFFDAEVLHRVLTENGFFVKSCHEFSIGFKSFAWSLDDRELVGAIARKPIPTPLQEHLVTSPADF